MARLTRRLLAAGLLTLVATVAVPETGGAAPTPLDAPIRTITLPVEGKFSYSADFGDPRSGGRTHAGNDLMAPKMRPLLAAADAKVRRLKIENGPSGEGNMLALRDAEGWEYWYLHVNNDTPGTDDGLSPREHVWAPGIEVGTSVKAGQVIAYTGDSGNAEGTGSHLHFEIHRPDGTAIDPYPSLRIAQGFRFANYCAFDTNPKRKPDALSATGYWLLGADGGIFTFGAAPFLGSTGNQRLNRPAVAMASVPGGTGYWFAGADGGIFAFGDAGFFGSTGAITLNQPIVGLAATPTGKGYWLVAQDGGIFAFGDAGFFGSTGGVALNQPIVGLAAPPRGTGYWLLAKDGGVFNFGATGFYGSLPGTGLCERPAAARLVPSATGQGYWIAAIDGSLWPMGDTTDFGSPKTLGLTLGAPVLDAVAVPPPAPATKPPVTKPPVPPLLNLPVLKG